jgi:hypothetical protein
MLLKRLEEKVHIPGIKANHQEKQTPLSASLAAIRGWE